MRSIGVPGFRGVDERRPGQTFAWLLGSGHGGEWLLTVLAATWLAHGLEVVEDERYRRDLALRLVPVGQAGRADWLARINVAPNQAGAEGLRPAMEAAHADWAQSFYRPLAALERERVASAARGQEAQPRLFREAYRLNLRPGAAYAKPLECAWLYLSRQAGPPFRPIRTCFLERCTSLHRQAESIARGRRFSLADRSRMGIRLPRPAGYFSTAAGRM